MAGAPRAPSTTSHAQPPGAAAGGHQEQQPQPRARAHLATAPPASVQPCQYQTATRLPRKRLPCVCACDSGWPQQATCQSAGCCCWHHGRVPSPTCAHGLSKGVAWLFAPGSSQAGAAPKRFTDACGRLCATCNALQTTPQTGGPQHRRAAACSVEGRGTALRPFHLAQLVPGFIHSSTISWRSAPCKGGGGRVRKAAAGLLLLVVGAGAVVLLAPLVVLPLGCSRSGGPQCGPGAGC
jgi:hypothetical protein